MSDQTSTPPSSQGSGQHRPTGRSATLPVVRTVAEAGSRDEVDRGNPDRSECWSPESASDEDEEDDGLKRGGQAGPYRVGPPHVRQQPAYAPIQYPAQPRPPPPGPALYYPQPAPGYQQPVQMPPQRPVAYPGPGGVPNGPPMGPYTNQPQYPPGAPGCPAQYPPAMPRPPGPGPGWGFPPPGPQPRYR
ncbi:hypothetical protein CALCODRAFT_500119 [Calocera cornea HHB12733]|uniref:Uncharacterized protein n=1 Tax=Calocera cornea HHB12733 TaxID=1353952 RepID=A0A165E7P6_9BASI|nr:hypothetical protein CALCODRAFT_500119 [Calocera cornea HHB12733]